ncbi:hypothetical protein CFN78_10060 [Amycolatopsis antarctica]|uniref:OmpR/PhoB-type domain-containing protein n=1 Tax=Amycolatopsis antarctica TaxID=1854586 RepID=A0A263D6V5_9PSEU|nr:BTAD domain-containing putative transcriptional regulator [Amycolatopsis antarctica]OZM73206.1 hypothetical protein CFN78_10060 [Amycolatopsis antarctica]
MRVGILGPTDVRDPDGRALAVPGPRARALLTLLALGAGSVVGTSRLIDGLYGEAVPSGAVNALQSQVSRLRRALGSGAAVVESHAGGYRLAVDPDQVDVHRFARLAAEGRQALDAGEPIRAAALLREANALWRGPALADAPLAGELPWLEELRLDALADGFDARLRCGEHAGLVAGLRKLTASHPLREQPHVLLVRALHGAGRTPEALTAYETARRMLAEELGVDPSAELAAAHLAVLRGEPSVPGRSRLPAQLTSFVGRDEELARVTELLERGRLVTLTGPGGTGKTRLAIEAAGGAGPAVEACLVELAPLTDPADVPQAALTALGLREVAIPVPVQERTPASPVERLVEALTERPVLLVLDNCEHLVEAAARLAGALLAACPPVRILATSREPLGITGEALLPVPRLRAAPPGTEPALALDYPAVRMFADRAVAGRPDFTLDGSTVDDVLRICEALDGLPLAIELAAARLRSLPVAEVAARLDDRFSLLSKGSRTASSRHRTLRGVVEWSWGLLDDGERELAAGLTVFSGGVTLAAAERVCRASDALDALSGLVDKSLVESIDGRYRMLRTIHAFCAERLADSGRTEGLRRAHAEHFLALAETAAPHLLRAEQLDWLALLDPEHDNLHAALRWAIDADTRLALRLASVLVPYWWMRGRRSEGAVLAAELAVRVGTSPPDDLAQEYATCVLNALFDPPENVRLHEHLRVAEQVVQSLTGPPRQPFVTVLHAVVVGPPATDSALRTRIVAITGRDRWTAALAPMGQGMLELYRGDLAGARSLLTSALGSFRELGERWGLSMVLGALGQLEGWQGRCDRALELIDEAVGLTEELGAIQETADLFAMRAEAQLVAGRVDGARVDYERAAELARRAGSVDKAAVARLGLAELALGRGELDEAGTLAERVTLVTASTRFELEETRMRALSLLGRIAAARGRTEEALALHLRGLTASIGGPSVQAAAYALEGLAELAWRDGAVVRAARLLGAAGARRGIGLAGATGIHAQVRDRLGEAGYEREHAHGAGLDEAGIRALTGLPEA